MIHSTGSIVPPLITTYASPLEKARGVLRYRTDGGVPPRILTTKFRGTNTLEKDTLSETHCPRFYTRPETTDDMS